MVKITVPGEFTALLYTHVALARDDEAYYVVPVPPKGKNPVVALRASRAAGHWSPVSEKEYCTRVDRQC